jgi:hypothetical protein
MAYKRMSFGRAVLCAGSIMAVGGLLGAAAAINSEPQEAAKARYQKNFPTYATVMTESVSRNDCILQMGNRLSGVRYDFVQASAQACDLADALRR